jgi:SMC interacting uncharacterized protein involved in chromosome segregation
LLFLHTPPDWWWALSTCSWLVCLMTKRKYIKTSIYMLEAQDRKKYISNKYANKD